MIIHQYIFGAVSGLSNLAFILVIYLSFTSVINALHSFAWLKRASLLQDEVLFCSHLVNLNPYFSDSSIDLLIHSGVLLSIFLILWGTKLGKTFIKISVKILRFPLESWLWKVKYDIAFWMHLGLAFLKSQSLL